MIRFSELASVVAAVAVLLGTLITIDSYLARPESTQMAWLVEKAD